MSAPTNGSNGERTILRALAAWALVALQALVVFMVQTSLQRLERLEEWRAVHTVETVQKIADNDRDKADLRREVAALRSGQDRQHRVTQAIARRVGVRLDQVQ